MVFASGGIARPPRSVQPERSRRARESGPVWSRWEGERRRRGVHFDFAQCERLWGCEIVGGAASHDLPPSVQPERSPRPRESGRVWSRWEGERRRQGVHFDFAQCERLLGCGIASGRDRTTSYLPFSLSEVEGHGTRDGSGRDGKARGGGRACTSISPSASGCGDMGGGLTSPLPETLSTRERNCRSPKPTSARTSIRSGGPGEYHAATSSTSPAAAPSSLFSSVFSRPPLVIRSPVRSVR
ncbi:hypothetical protein QE363_000967 [Sphingomonas sp. SORGH_AS870]|nr:hypothetical protein [Sphingomonas sp. SORGH_AS_0870]